MRVASGATLQSAQVFVGWGLQVGRTSDFTLDTTAFTNAFTGTWSISSTTNALALNYTASAIPEPSTYAALAGLACLALAAWHRQAKRKTLNV